MYDMLGRFASEDVRDRSVQALMVRYSVDKKQAKRVVKTAQLLFDQVKNRLGLDDEDADLLRRAAYLHEIGLAISHSSYHRHSAYLLQNSDIDGFSQVDKTRMAQLVLHHRRKLKIEGYDEVKMVGGDSLVYLTLLLRLAVILHHNRSKQDEFALRLSVQDETHWTLALDDDSDSGGMLIGDLHDEAEAWQKWHMHLTIEALNASSSSQGQPHASAEAS